MSQINCQRCSATDCGVWRFSECDTCGPVFLCIGCIEVHRGEMAEEKAWEAEWATLSPEEQRRRIEHWNSAARR